MLSIGRSPYSIFSSHDSDWRILVHDPTPQWLGSWSRRLRASRDHFFGFSGESTGWGRPCAPHAKTPSRQSGRARHRVDLAGRVHVEETCVEVKGALHWGPPKTDAGGGPSRSRRSSFERYASTSGNGRSPS